jgi:hypothetical protein
MRGSAFVQRFRGHLSTVLAGVVAGWLWSATPIYAVCNEYCAWGSNCLGTICDYGETGDYFWDGSCPQFCCFQGVCWFWDEFEPGPCAYCSSDDFSECRYSGICAG